MIATTFIKYKQTMSNSLAICRALNQNQSEFIRDRQREADIATTDGNGYVRETLFSRKGEIT